MTQFCVNADFFKLEERNSAVLNFDTDMMMQQPLQTDFAKTLQNF